MTEVRLRARTVSELVDAAFELYRRDPGKYVLFMAFAITPQLITQILLQSGTRLGLGAALAFIVSGLVSAFTYTMGSAAIMKFGAAVYLGEEADVEATLQCVIPKVGTILWAGFLKLLLYFAGIFVFFIGEFYVAARFFAVTAAIVLEDARTAPAFARSTELSAGRKRHILNTLLLVWIIYALLSGCVVFAAAAAKSQVVTLVAGAAYQIIAYPVFGLTTMLLYYDCRIRSEGFDIERMAASLGAGPSSAPGIAGAAL
jgi:hypothetical protein